ncbi:MAG: hypothetical protein WCD35_18255 [Mycobacteriales bacterium]
MAAAEQLRPARGVDLAQVLPVTAVLAALGAALIAACVLYRKGRLPAVERLLARVEAETGLPAWATVPTTVSMVSLLFAGFGFYWDVAVHIDNGRDSSPFGTPAHWPIVIGLCGLAAAGILAITLDRDTDGGAALHLPGGLHCSLGATLVLLCGSVSLAGFPLDDLWHNVFGQDVTLWSPTHIQMIGGASLTTLATWVLVEEGRRRSAGAPARNTPLGRLLRPSRNRMATSFMIGLSTLQAEFDYGVPQFNPIYHPLLIALAAGIGLTAARLTLGRGGAIRAAVGFLIGRGLWALVIGGGLGLTTPSMPLYLAEALLVEGAALLVGTHRQIRFGLVSGALIGTAGVAAEWGWSQLVFPLPWHAVLFPEAAVLALLAALSGSVLGALIGRALLPASSARQATPRFATGLAFACVLAVIGIALPIGSHDGYRASVDITAAATPGTANLLIRLSPPEIADQVAWFNVTSWQGGSRDVPGTGQQLTPLQPLGHGVYRTQRPVPVTGNWKTLVRLATPTTLQALPIYLPEDKAIPAALVPALPHVDRAFVPDKTILQREQVGGSDTLKHVAYAILGALALLWIATLSLGLQRLDRSAVRALSPLHLGLTRLPRRTTATSPA